jgi:polar amino acid transport system substrate-binding protein
MRDGALEAIFRKWKIWNDDQRGSLRGARRRHDRAGDGYEPTVGGAAEVGSDATLSAVAVRAAVLTLCCRAARCWLAVGARDGIATGRYTADRSRRRLDGYVELIRGTPLLLQLFVLYYGIAAGDQAAAFRRRCSGSR